MTSTVPEAPERVTPSDASESPRVDEDVEKAVSARAMPAAALDIEHAVVEDDPRQWSHARKTFVLVIVSAASTITGLGGNIYNPGISQIESELHATSGEVSLSLSLFILLQGTVPLFWSAVSEIVGRKKVYLASITLCTVGCIVAGTAKSIGVLIGMRCLQAAGSAAVLSIGAATLADIYEPHERGTMMGIYYCAPLLGPSLGPIIGGALTQGFNWRATFYFLAIFTGVCALAFIPFKDTFRRERSLTYQLVLKRVQAERAAARRSETSSLSHVTVVERESGAWPWQLGAKKSATKSEPKMSFKETKAPVHDDDASVKEIRLSLKDVNPIRPLFAVLHRMNNLAILFASGLIFAFSYSIAYTCARTLDIEYHYNALQIGLVLLSYGAGSMLGSILGGRWSDRTFRRLKAQNGGTSMPEMRLRSTLWFMIFLPPSIAAYGWVCEEHVHVAAICVTLFLAGFFSICIYASTLAYIVDANTGRSSSAVASNSCFRGGSAFVAAEVAVPLQLGIGDGGLYSLWAGLMVLSELLILLVWWKGSSWRETAIAREEAQSEQPEPSGRGRH